MVRSPQTLSEADRRLAAAWAATRPELTRIPGESEGHPSVLGHRPGLSRGHPIKRLVRIIFSAPVRRRYRALGGPFYALRLSPPPTDTPDGSPESREQRRIAKALPVPPTQVNHTGAACAPSAAATSLSAPTRRASSTSQRISDGERVPLRPDGPGLNVAGALVNGEDHAILGHQTVRHLKGRRHRALAEKALA
jgi:hypothetical protein